MIEEYDSMKESSTHSGSTSMEVDLTAAFSAGAVFGMNSEDSVAELDNLFSNLDEEVTNAVDTDSQSNVTIINSATEWDADTVLEELNDPCTYGDPCVPLQTCTEDSGIIFCVEACYSTDMSSPQYQCDQASQLCMVEQTAESYAGVCMCKDGYLPKVGSDSCIDRNIIIAVCATVGGIIIIAMATVIILLSFRRKKSKEADLLGDMDGSEYRASQKSNLNTNDKIAFVSSGNDYAVPDTQYVVNDAYDDLVKERAGPSNYQALQPHRSAMRGDSEVQFYRFEINQSKRGTRGPYETVDGWTHL